MFVMDLLFGKPSARDHPGQDFTTNGNYSHPPGRMARSIDVRGLIFIRG